MRAINIMAVVMLAVSITAIAHMSITWSFYRDLYASEAALFETGRMVKKYIDKTGHLPPARSIHLFFPSRPSASYLYNTGSADGSGDNSDSIKWPDITAPSNTILFAQHTGPAQATDAKGISKATVEAVKCWKGKGYLVLYADGHTELLKEALRPDDTRLKFKKDGYVVYAQATLCKGVKGGNPVGPADTFLKEERIYVHIKWKKANSNRVSFEVFSPRGYCIEYVNLVNKNDPVSTKSFDTKPKKWATGDYTLVIYINGKEAEAKQFKLL